MNTHISRRQLLANASTGFGMAAFAGLMQAETSVYRAKRFAPKARSVIFCYMSGGVSHLDSFDPKPLLTKLNARDRVHLVIYAYEHGLLRPQGRPPTPS